MRNIGTGAPAIVQLLDCTLQALAGVENGDNAFLVRRPDFGDWIPDTYSVSSPNPSGVPGKPADYT
jgi:hypothetical protein